MNNSIDALQSELDILARHIGQMHRTVAPSRRLDRSAVTLLSRIAAEGPMSIGQLGPALGLDASTLNRQTAAATRAGLIERIADPMGGAARKFALTAEGRGRLEDERSAVRSKLETIVTDWDEERIDLLGTMLLELNERYEDQHARPWPRNEQ